tara:strand:- start:7489 stop:8340 length:852 start_codon:yes stop_codon:yes gene_type:complete
MTPRQTSCEERQQDYLFGMMDEQQEADFQSHLASCPDCQNAISELAVFEPPQQLQAAEAQVSEDEHLFLLQQLFTLDEEDVCDGDEHSVSHEAPHSWWETLWERWSVRSFAMPALAAGCMLFLLLFTPTHPHRNAIKKQTARSSAAAPKSRPVLRMKEIVITANKAPVVPSVPIVLDFTQPPQKVERREPLVFADLSISAKDRQPKEPEETLQITYSKDIFLAMEQGQQKTSMNIRANRRRRQSYGRFVQVSDFKELAKTGSLITHSIVDDANSTKRILLACL